MKCSILRLGGLRLLGLDPSAQPGGVASRSPCVLWAVSVAVHLGSRDMYGSVGFSVLLGNFLCVCASMLMIRVISCCGFVFISGSGQRQFLLGLGFRSPLILLFPCIVS